MRIYRSRPAVSFSLWANGATAKPTVSSEMIHAASSAACILADNGVDYFAYERLLLKAILDFSPVVQLHNVLETLHVDTIRSRERSARKQVGGRDLIRPGRTEE